MARKVGGALITMFHKNKQDLRDSQIRNSLIKNKSDVQERLEKFNEEIKL